MRAIGVLGLCVAVSAGLGGCGDDGGADSKPVEPGGPDGSVAGDGRVPDPRADGSTPGGPDAEVDVDGRVPGSDRGGPAVPRPVGTLEWKACGVGYQCSFFYVPLDYAAPDGDTTKVAIMRRPAEGKRLGALLINPGGPGSSAIDFLPDFVDYGSSKLADHFDLVAFDPRGVGYSNPLDCHGTLQQLIAADPTPDSEAEWQALDDASAAFAEECGAKYPKLLPHLGTLNVVRDMDRVREALGEDKLNFLGFSYGTALGARYAELFPERVGKLVLDGALDLSLSALDLTLQQAQAFERALASYFRWCGAAPQRCSWTAGATPEAAFAKLSAEVELMSIAAPDADRPVGPGELLTGVQSPLYYGEEGWVELSLALADAVSGDGSHIIDLVDQYHERREDGSYSNIEEVFNAVGCLDQAAPTMADIRAAEARFRDAAPVIGVSSLTSNLVCTHWPAQGKDLPVPTALTAPPIVVIGTTGDPATPYAWAQNMAKALASATLLTYDGEGHTAFAQGNACIDGAVEAYLFDGKVPAASATCASTVDKTLAEAKSRTTRRRRITR